MQYFERLDDDWKMVNHHGPEEFAAFRLIVYHDNRNDVLSIDFNIRMMMIKSRHTSEVNGFLKAGYLLCLLVYFQ